MTQYVKITFNTEHLLIELLDTPLVKKWLTIFNRYTDLNIPSVGILQPIKQYQTSLNKKAVTELVPKPIWSPEFFGPQEIWSPRNLGPRNLVPTPFWSPRNLVPGKFGPQEIWSPGNLVPRKNGPPKNLPNMKEIKLELSYLNICTSG